MRREWEEWSAKEGRVHASCVCPTVMGPERAFPHYLVLEDHTGVWCGRGKAETSFSVAQGYRRPTERMRGTPH